MRAGGRWLLAGLLVTALAWFGQGLRAAWRQETQGLAVVGSWQVLARAPLEEARVGTAHAAPPLLEDLHSSSDPHASTQYEGEGGDDDHHDHHQDHHHDHQPGAALCSCHGPTAADHPGEPAATTVTPGGSRPPAVEEAPVPHVHGPGCGHAYAHLGVGEGEGGPAISHGLIVLLEQLGLRELAANLLWIQMDADSHRGLWHRVEFALELIPAIDPHFVEAYLLLAYRYDEKGDYERSLQVLRTGMRNNPWRSELPIQIGVQCLNFRQRHGPIRRLSEALEAFTTACRLSDAPGYAFRLRAITLVAMGRRAEAIAWLEAVASDPARSPVDRQQDERLLERFRAGEEW